MYVGLKQPRGDGERYVTLARAAAKETRAKRTWGETTCFRLKYGFTNRIKCTCSTRYVHVIVYCGCNA